MVFCSDSRRLPVIDLSLFDLGDPWREQVAAQIDAASSDFGFFRLVGHGIDLGVIEPLLASGRRFFAAEDAVKRRVQKGRATPGDFAFVEELAARSSDPEHLYFEAQLTAESDDAGRAVSGPGLTFLPEVPGFREPVLDYMRSLTGLSHKLMAMIARGLRLQDSYFVDRYTGSPATSFRFLNYPRVAGARTAREPASSSADPGLLTILIQDTSGGLELRYRERWIDVPAMPNAFICSVGRALAHLTNGRYLAPAHRCSNSTETDRLAMSFCFEPTLNATLEPIAAAAPAVSAAPGEIASGALPDSPGRKIA